LFADYVAWAKAMLAGRGISARDLADHLQVLIDVLSERLPPQDAPSACFYVQNALAALPNMPDFPASCIAQDRPLTHLADSYLGALLACSRQEASRLVLDAVDHGTSIKDVYIHVFQESQKEIGRLWQTNQVTVAQEHYCTAATQLIMSQFYPKIFAGPRISRSFVGACVGGDLHEIGIRMVADFFEMEGWDTAYLGANVPGRDLIRTLQDRKPDVVGISATITANLSALAQTIAAIRVTPGCRTMKILVGGYPFLVVPDLWVEIGADGMAQDAQEAVDLAVQLTKDAA
jgi:methanogenic corrinoid protein MtbC1